jgi:hypothetical protein
MVVRHDVSIEAIGQMAGLPPDLSPLQIDATGEFDGVGFRIIGRVRMAYTEGSWNEWYALFRDGRQGWVAEAQGFFMVSFETTAGSPLTSEDALAPGKAFDLDGVRYHVTDRKETLCLGGEGELPFVAPAGRRALSIDLVGPGAQFAGIEFGDGNPRLFVGRYAHYDDLKFRGLRPIPGWSKGATEPEQTTATALTCPACGGRISLRAAGLSMSAKCNSCGRLLDTSTPDLAIIRHAEERQRFKPLIPLGSRGALFGIEYEVIGFQHVKDKYSGWFEYLLFNPWQGFVWLVNYQGHWSCVRRLFEPPEVKESGILQKVGHATLNGEQYRMFDVSSVTTDYVAGEFYWKVTAGMEANVTDFVSPPRILSREAYPALGEITWSQGEYVEAKVIQEAFKLEQALPQKRGVYLNQPNPWSEKARGLSWLAPLIILSLLAVQLISVGRAAKREIVSNAYVYHQGATNGLVVTAPFDVPGGAQALDFALQAPVDNNWLEVGIDLVNTQTMQPVEAFDEGVEFYHGDDDGYWSEGGQTKHRLLSAVPPGNYVLAIEPSADPAIREMPFTLTVTRDVPVWSNFWIALALAAIYPLYCLVRAYSFERNRWMQSDYSPYASSTK